jgi:hypothetical protein
LPRSLPPRGLSRGEAAAYVGIRTGARAACKFKQCDITRAIRAVAKAGVAIARVEIAPDGNIIISTSTVASAQTDHLDKELADFEARHGQG